MIHLGWAFFLMLLMWIIGYWMGKDTGNTDAYNDIRNILNRYPEMPDGVRLYSDVNAWLLRYAPTVYKDCDCDVCERPV